MSSHDDVINLSRMIEALRSPDWATSADAVSAMVSVGPPAVTLLREVLLDERASNESRRRAAIALGRIGTDEAVQALDNALNDGDWLIRFGVACGLAEVAGPEAVDALVHAAWDQDFNVAGVAIRAFRRVGEPAVLPLMALLRRNDYPRRSRIADELAWLKDPRAAAPLLEVLRDSDPALRAAAADALGVVGSGQAEVALINALSDQDFDVRANAASALGQLGETRALPKLRWMADHDEGETSDGDSVRDIAKDAATSIAGGQMGRDEARLRSDEG